MEVAERPTRKPRHGSFTPAPHPNHDEGWYDEEEDPDNLEIEDLDNGPDDGRMRMEYKRALEEAHRAVAESMGQRDMYRQEVQREIERAMVQAQAELARVNPEAIRQQVRSQMDSYRDAMRQAAEELRRVQIESDDEDGI